MESFFNKVGKMALGSRLRMLNERLLSDAERIYALYEVHLKPKWFPVFYVLSEGRKRSITEIAQEIGHSHPSVCNIVREMSKAGIVTERADKNDGRKNIIQLSKKGQLLESKIQDQYVDVDKAVAEALLETTHNLWTAMAEFEYQLEQRSMYQRVRDVQKKRESEKVKIVPYESQYREAFRTLNEEWIHQYFKMEEMDYKSLHHPKDYILDRGGHILVALYENEAVGVCALIRTPEKEYDYELAKMGVSPKMHGKGIGWKLGNAIVDKARELGAEKIYLESNTILEPAIALYRKLGFQKISGKPSPYERSNIQMSLEIP